MLRAVAEIQSNDATSPPAGVTAPQNISGLTPGRITRTLPSNIATGSPAENEVCGIRMSASRGFGRSWNVNPGTDGRETGRADLVLVAIIALALLGKLSDSLLVTIEHRVLQWRDVADLQGRQP